MILFVSRTDGTDTRIRKEVKTLVESGAKVKVFLLPNNDGEIKGLGFNHKNLLVVHLPNFTRVSKVVGFIYLNLLSIVYLLNYKIKSVHCVDEETFLIVLFARLFGKNVVLDLFDSVELKKSEDHSFKARLLRRFSIFTKTLASKIIVTDYLRYELQTVRQKNKSVVIPNYPSISTLPEVRIINSHESEQPKTKIFVGGSLSEGRGLNTLIEALNLSLSLEVHCAGWLYDRAANEFIEHDRVYYYGVLDQKAANELSNSCAVSIALYEPSNKNNIYASPNKVYDSMCMGQFVILNSETKLAKWISKSPLVKCCSYYDANQLVEAVCSCNEDISVRRIKRYRKLFTWEKFESVLVETHLG